MSLGGAIAPTDAAGRPPEVYYCKCRDARYTMDAYDKRVLFEEYYSYLESSFMDVMKMIPLENKPETFSPRLYELLHSVCSQTEGVLKLICDEVGLKYTNFPETYAQLNHEGAISIQSVVLKFRPKWKRINPFLCDFGCHCRETEHHCHTPRKKPKWWDAYNESKHGLPEGYTGGTIENTYLALASLYALQHMAWSRARNPDGFLRQDFWFMTNMPAFVDGKPRLERDVSGVPSRMFTALAWLLEKES